MTRAKPQPAAPDAGAPRSLASQLLELTRHSAIYGIGGLMSRFLAVLMLPLYTSYVSAGDYGRIELLMSVMAVAVVVIRGGANFGFIRFYFLDKDPDYRRRLVRTVFWAQMAYSTLALVLCVVFALADRRRWLGVDRRPGAHLQGSGTSLVIATAVLLWVNVNYAQMTNLFRAEKRSVAFSIATLLNIGITVPLTVILVVVYQRRPARDHRRQPQRHARRLPRAARLPPRAARPPVRPEAPALAQPLRVPAHGAPRSRCG